MAKLTEEEKLKRKATREANKKEKEKIQKEQHRVDKLERSLEELRQGWVNEPTYFFKVGDRVAHGALIKSTITEVIDDGKIYKMREVCRGGRELRSLKGEDATYERDFYAAWVDLRPYVATPEPREESFAYEVDKFRRFTYYNNSIESLLSRNYSSYGGIDTEPDYQRELVWELKDKVALIDSIFKKIDIGKFTFIKIPFTAYEKGYEILDGKQRLNAMIEFYEDRFTYRGKTFSELSWYDKYHFREHPISLGETEPMTDQEKYEYFLRLNTGGKEQDPTHIEYVRGLMK